MPTGVPIKVKIGLKDNGHADYPDWTQLPLQKIGRVKHETHQIHKWVFDKASGHDIETLDSPRGQQFGMMIVTEQYAKEAVALFSDVVTIMTEAEAKIFWETKGTAHVPENSVDTIQLQALKAQRDLMVDLRKNLPEIAKLDVEIAKALDPLNPVSGVIKNKSKMWADMKAEKGITIKP